MAARLPRSAAWRAVIERHSKFFSKGAMEFFQSRCEGDPVSPPYESKRVYFITSEQFVASDGERDARAYTVRVSDWSESEWSVESVSEFQEYATLAEAKAAMWAIAGVTR